MRIAYLVTAFGLGGAETQVILLAREMRARGHDVVVVRLRNRPDALVAQLHDNRLPTLSLGLDRHWQVLPALWRARAWARAWRPDVVHSHMVHANIFARLLRLIAPVPRLVCTAHSADEGGASRMWAYRLTDRLADLTTSVAPHAVAAMLARGGAPPGRVMCVPSGIDARRFRPDPAAGERLRAGLGLTGHRVFLAVGNLLPPKDYPTLVRAFAEVHRRRPEARLLVAGDGPLRDDIAALIRSLGLGAAVRLLGVQDDIPALINASDGLVMSSRWEGLPTALLEAMACAKPVITTEFGGAAALVGAAGAVVPPGDPPALAAAILRLAADRDAGGAEALAMGTAGRALIERDYAIEAVCDRWEAIYRSADRRPPAPDPLSATARRHDQAEVAD